MHIIYKCPCCGHAGIALTNNHCKTVHGMNKKELIELHGEPMKYFVNRPEEVVYGFR